MKKVILIVIILIVVYFIYDHYIAEPRRILEEETSNLSVAGLRARQTEARQLLRMAYQKEESYFALHGKYSKSLDELQVQSRGTYYDLVIKTAKGQDFEIRAEGNIDNDGYKDVWVIDETGQAYNLIDDVTKN